MQNFATLVSFTDLVGASQEMLDCLQLAERVSETNLSVFIWGERGTGGLQLANFIHTNSERTQLPFLIFSAESLTREAQERELFGIMVEGRRYIGKLELAQGGTVFIDRIDLLDQSVQNQLFRVLSSREFEPANTGKTVKLDCRIISSSLYPPDYLNQNKIMKLELLYRLEGVPFGLPALRNRGADIHRLAEKFIEIICTVHELPQKRLSIHAIQSLFAHQWFGNAEELFNCLEKACFSTGNEIPIEDLQLNTSKPVNGIQSAETKDLPNILSLENNFLLPIEEVKKRMFQKALHITKNDVEKSAELLGISRATAFRLLKNSNESGDNE